MGKAPCSTRCLAASSPILPAPTSSTARPVRPAKIFLASSTAANDTDTAWRAISVSAAHLLATAKAWVNSVCRVGPTVSQAWASAKALLHLAEDLRLPDHHGVEAGGDAEGVAHGVRRPRACRARARPWRVDPALATEMPEDRAPRLARRLGHRRRPPPGCTSRGRPLRSPHAGAWTSRRISRSLSSSTAICSRKDTGAFRWLRPLDEEGHLRSRAAREGMRPRPA